MRKGHIMSVIVMCLLTIMIGLLAPSNQINKLALGQPSPTDAATTYSMNGPVSSLVFGMAPNTKIIDMTTVQKFILSDDRNMNVNHGKLADFKANFYTGPVNGGTSNHTHQLSNFRVGNDNGIIHLTPDKSTSISGIVDVGNKR